MEAQAAQVIGHAARGHGAGIQAQQWREMRTHVFVGEPLGQQTIEDQHAQERLHTRIGEGQGGHALVADDLGPRDLLERVVAEEAIVAELLDVEQTSIGGEADRPQRGQVVQPFADGKVTGVVDRRFGP